MRDALPNASFVGLTGTPIELASMELYQTGLVSAVRDPTAPGAIARAISNYINRFRCRPG